jgi:hypothetical protein
VKAVPALAGDTASVELASMAKRAANPKPEALKSWAGGKDRPAIVDVHEPG